MTLMKKHVEVLMIVNRESFEHHGHVMRNQKYDLLLLLIQGKIVESVLFRVRMGILVADVL